MNATLAGTTPELADLASESVVRYGLDRRALYWNPAWNRLYGHSVNPPTWSFGDWASDRAFEAEIWRQVAEVGVWRGVVRRWCADVREILVDVRVVLRRDQTGAPLDVVEYGQRQAIAEPAVSSRPIWELEASELRYRHLIHHIQIPLWKVDARAAGDVFEELKRQGVTDIASYLAEHPDLVELAKDVVLVTEANTDAAALFAAAEPSQLVAPVRYLFEGAPGAAARVMAAHFEGARNHAEELKIRTFDGRERDVVFLVTYPAPSETLDTTLIMMIDITERLETEARLRRLESNYTHAARLLSLGELVGSIAHEIKQPLFAIATNGETSLRWLSREPPHLAKAMELNERIVASARQANAIIQRIQAMAARAPPVRDAVDFNSVVEEALSFVRHEMEQREIDVHRQLRQGLPPLVGDRVQLQQVVVNLLLNSLQALSNTPPGARLVSLTTHAEAGHIVLEVSDSGPGIAPELREQVFDNFFTTKRSGMGIGLPICRTILASHGGEIVAEAAAQSGARMIVTIPFQALAARVGDPHPAARQPTPADRVANPTGPIDAGFGGPQT